MLRGGWRVGAQHGDLDQRLLVADVLTHAERTFVRVSLHRTCTPHGTSPGFCKESGLTETSKWPCSRSEASWISSKLDFLLRQSGPAHMSEGHVLGRQASDPQPCRAQRGGTAAPPSPAPRHISLATLTPPLQPCSCMHPEASRTPGCHVRPCLARLAALHWTRRRDRVHGGGDSATHLSTTTRHDPVIIIGIIIVTNKSGREEGVRTL